MSGKTLMIMGTSSSAGKSLLTAAICRCFARRGVRVAPFKSQNMSNNAAVCIGGGEIGRSQYLQAIAAGVSPTTDMNPILLKPEGDSHSQVIVNGRPWQSLDAQSYFDRKRELWPVATSALDRLREQYELVIIEGAGSPAELNLSSVEIVNMAIARYCQSPVLLVGDIERGGIFAQLLGTLWLLPPADRALVRGLIVNKFRGDRRLFDSGREILESRGETDVLGVLPWVDGLNLPEEDAVALSNDTPTVADAVLDVAVIRFPHIANFDDFDPLANVPRLRLRYVASLDQLGRPDVIILPGTKNTLGDLGWLRSSGLAQRVVAFARQGKPVIGICGGYQILGRKLYNPARVESDVESADGLGLLAIETTFAATKQTCQVTARVTDDVIAPGSLGQSLSGYEIHVGRTTTASPWLRRSGTPVDAASEDDDCSSVDGCRTADGKVWGCYLHGLFHNDAFRDAWLASLGFNGIANPLTSAQKSIDLGLNRIADAVETELDWNRLEQIIWNPQREPANV